MSEGPPRRPKPEDFFPSGKIPTPEESRKEIAPKDLIEILDMGIYDSLPRKGVHTKFEYNLDAALPESPVLRSGIITLTRLLFERAGDTYDPHYLASLVREYVEVTAASSRLSSFPEEETPETRREQQIDSERRKEIRTLVLELLGESPVTFDPEP